MNFNDLSPEEKSAARIRHISECGFEGGPVELSPERQQFWEDVVEEAYNGAAFISRLKVIGDEDVSLTGFYDHSKFVDYLVRNPNFQKAINGNDYCELPKSFVHAHEMHWDLYRFMGHFSSVVLPGGPYCSMMHLESDYMVREVEALVREVFTGHLFSYRYYYSHDAWNHYFDRCGCDRSFFIVSKDGREVVVIGMTACD